MAQVLDEIPPRLYRDRPHYPWDTWLDGQVWECTAGEDFHSTVKAFRNAAFSAARHRGLVLTTRKTPTGLVLQAGRR